MYLRYLPNDMLKWLKNSRLYGSIDEIFDVFLSMLQYIKQVQIGKALNGKELGKSKFCKRSKRQKALKTGGF